MDNGLLFEGEEIISESENKAITLTSHRIRYNSSGLGSGDMTSIMIDKISSIEVHYKSAWYFLIVGIVLIAGGLLMGANNQGEQMVLGLGGGLVFVVIYVLSRKHVITIASDGGAKINFSTKGMKREKLMEFINKIERAKTNYKTK